MSADESKVPAERGNEGGEPSDAAKLLHGETARAEKYDQPEAVTLPGDTRIASPATDDNVDRGQDESKGSGSL